MDASGAGLPDFDALWDYDDPAASECAFRDVLAQVEGRADAVYRLELLTQVARAQGLRRRFDDAHTTLDSVLAELGAIHVDSPRPRLRYLLERGRAYNSSGRVDEARQPFLDAWRLASEGGEDALAVDAAHMLGIVEPGEAGRAWNERALALARASSDPRVARWQGSLLNNLGWSYHEAGDYPRALELFERALAFRESQGDSAQIRVARWCVARALRCLGRTQEALDQQLVLLGEHERAGTTDGYVFEETGECLLALGRGEEARPYLARAHAELAKDPWLAEREPGRLARLASLAAG